MKHETQKEARQMRKPSSSTAGFFQERPKLENQYFEDVALRRVQLCYLPSEVQNAIQSDLAAFGDKVRSRQVFDWVADAEKNPPYLRTWDTWGRRRDDLVTSEGWKRLQELGIAEGIVAVAYESQHNHLSRFVQFLKYHLWTGSCAYATCPSAMTDGAARLLSLYRHQCSLEARPVLDDAISRLTSRNPDHAWTSGQWMTERSGGSDVSETETIASSAGSLSGRDSTGKALGPWSIDGFKWFSSATDSSMTVMLAQTKKGLSAFYAPMRRQMSSSSSSDETELNGIRIQRLKSKLGTRALPTAELELQGVRAWLIGEEGQGVKAISTVLNITRIHNSITAVGLWGRGLAISRAFAKVRRTRGKKLQDVPAHVRTLAIQHVEYRAMMHLAHFTTLLLGLSEHTCDKSTSTALGVLKGLSISQIHNLLRILTPVAKGTTAKAAIRGLAECMESLGGVGYLENEEMEFNIARLFRDVNVLSIWEGTTNIMALDTLRVLKGGRGKDVLEALEKILENCLRHGQPSITNHQIQVVWRSWNEFRCDIEQSPSEDLQLRGREMMKRIADLVSSALFISDFSTDEDEIAGEVARRWIRQCFASEPQQSSQAMSTQYAIRADFDIVFGHRLDPASARL